MFKRAALAVTGVALAVSATAQPQRTLLVRERSLPAAGSFEVGALGLYEEASLVAGGFKIATEDIYGIEPYVRYGVAENLSFHLAAPFVQRTSDFMGTESGPGDLRIGADLLVYEDIFRYPWILPYADVTLPTGDEDKGLGLGDPALYLGIAIGTQMYEKIGLALDVRRDMISGVDNTSSIGGSVVWDLNDEFSLLAEGRIFERHSNQSSPPRQFLAGMVYWPTPQWMVGAYGGQNRHDVTDTIGLIKVAYLIPRWMP